MRTPLNVPIGPHRRFAGVRGRLDEFKLIKDVYGGTVNDVVLTAVAGGLRRWLRLRGVRTEGLELRALVPVSRSVIYAFRVAGADWRKAAAAEAARLRGEVWGVSGW